MKGADIAALATVARVVLEIEILVDLAVAVVVDAVAVAVRTIDRGAEPEGAAVEIVVGRIDTADTDRRRQHGIAREEVLEKKDAVGDVELAVVVRVGRIGTGDTVVASTEEFRQETDGIGDIDLPVRVDVTTHEERGALRLE